MVAALLCCPLVSAQEPAAPTAPAAPAAAATLTPDEARAAADTVIAAMTELVAILESVTDKTSADAAVAKLEALKTRMEATQAKLEGMSGLDEAVQQEIGMKMLPALFMIAPRMEKVSEALEANDFYGSEALKGILEADEDDLEDIEDEVELDSED